MRNSRAGVTLGRPCWAPGEKHPRLPVYCDREHTDTHTYRDTDTQTHTETHTYRDTYTQTHTETHIETHRDTDRHTDTTTLSLCGYCLYSFIPSAWSTAFRHVCPTSELSCLCL